MSSLGNRRHTLTDLSQAALRAKGHYVATDVSDFSSLRPVRRAARRPTLEDMPTPGNIRRMLTRAQTRLVPEPIAEEEPEKPYKTVAGLSIVLNVLSVLPYVRILAVDPQSPVFIAFVTSVFIVCMNLPKAASLVRDRRLPMKFHFGFIALAYAFSFLKSDAFSRLPSAVAMVLLNLQMLVGMVVQAVIFKQSFSGAQISGCAVVTLGVLWSGVASAGQRAGGSGDDPGAKTQFLIGAFELFGSLVAAVFLNILVKTAFSKFGERVDEQIFFQNLLGLPLFLFGGQWAKIGPKITEWSSSGNYILMLMLLVNLVLTFLGGRTRIEFAGRAPNALLVQLVETLTKFISLFATAMVNSPPFPPLGFWGGSGLLVLGTLQFLTASDSSTGAPDSDNSGQEDEDAKAR